MNQIISATPVLFVSAIEPCLPFWNALGFEKTVEVPEGERLGFAILHKDGVDVMYQTLESAEKDDAEVAKIAQSNHTFLFVKVTDLAEVESALIAQPVIMSKRTTFYGANEIGYREPGGHSIIFAQFAQ